MWNSELYNKYGKERIQPSVDLVNRIRDNNFKRILDVGCGSGMSTVSVKAMWKNAEIIGVDLSEKMLEAARKAIPDITFIQRDCSKPLSDMGSFDLIFSNAFIQWIPDHEGFIKHSCEMLNPDGVFAAQIPLFYMMQAHKCIEDAEKVLPERLQGGTVRWITTKSPDTYYDIMSKYFGSVDIWVTDYFHVMESVENILEFIRGTALNPYLELLDGNEQDIFLKEVLENLKRSYASQENGKVLFPFKRLFLVGRK